MQGPLAQSVERGADNAKVVSSILTRTREYSLVSIKPSEQKTNLLLTFHFMYVYVCLCIFHAFDVFLLSMIIMLKIETWTPEFQSNMNVK